MGRPSAELTSGAFLAHFVLRCPGGGGARTMVTCGGVFPEAGACVGRSHPSLQRPCRWVSRKTSLFVRLYFTRSGSKRLLPFAFIYSFEGAPPIFNLYQNLEAWHLFCRSVAHPFPARPQAGGWRARCPVGGGGCAAIHISPGDRRTNHSAAGDQGEDKSGERLMSQRWLQPEKAFRSLLASGWTSGS